MQLRGKTAMKKCVVVSDSFKGTLSSAEICGICRDHIRSVFPGCNVVALPTADGGEGTVECFIAAMDAAPVHVTVSDALGRKTDAVYAVMGRTAVIEMAAAAGLPALGNKKDPGIATTFGVGEMIRDAVFNGCDRILLGLGGSATNDGGCGCAAALGTVFKDSGGKEFIPAGDTLHLIGSYDCSKTESLLKGVSVTAMCDVRNPLYGPEGAAYVFGPQKGADPEKVVSLDKGLEHLGDVILRQSGQDIASVPGSGAAGGMGAGVMAFLGAELKPGIDAILDTVGFSEIASDADLVITGEGKLDSQSFQGKVIDGVSARTRKLGVPLIAIVGCIDDSAGDYRAHGIRAVFPTTRKSMSFERIKKRAAADYASALDDILGLIETAENIRR